MTAPSFLYNIPIVCYDKETEITAGCCAFWGERLLINLRSNESIDKYNKTASRIAMENGVEINDLNQYMKNWESKHYIDTCHPTPDAFAVLGKEVARVLYMKMENK
jgi:lysophospholipase L1-like esterase